MAITDFRGVYRWLSNFQKVDVSHMGLSFTTTEAAYQAAKTFVNDEVRSIQSATTPGKAQRLGQKVTLRDDWEDVKLRVMRKLTRQKFCEPELREKLLATGNQHLMEGNTWNDQFWGVCKGNGLNHLGRILMDVREEIRKETL